MGKKILIAVAVLVVGFLGVVMAQPDTYKVERTATIQAPVDVVFGLVNDMPARAAWYPWDRLDPNMTRTYSDQTVGVGASYEWSGNDQVGTGSQEILESEKNVKIVDSLHFKEPFDSKNTATFQFNPKGDQTEVTWSIAGGDGFMTRLAGLFMSMDDAVGGDFEKGLKYLDEAAQAEVAKQAEAAKADAAPTDDDAPPSPADDVEPSPPADDGEPSGAAPEEGGS